MQLFLMNGAWRMQGLDVHRNSARVFYILIVTNIYSTQIHPIFKGFVENCDANLSPLTQNQGVISVKLIDSSKAFAWQQWSIWSAVHCSQSICITSNLAFFSFYFCRGIHFFLQNLKNSVDTNPHYSQEPFPFEFANKSCTRSGIRPQEVMYLSLLYRKQCCCRNNDVPSERELTFFSGEAW